MDFSERTVLVLGAGASMPFGFPSGVGLKWEMIPELAEGHPLYKVLLTAFGDDRKIKQFGAALRDSGQQSVDAFLEHRPEFSTIGKGAIAATLLPKELHGRMFCAGSWYEYLFPRLPTHFAEIAGRLSVVTFNYDRTLEEYLFTAIRNSYGLSDTEAATWLKHLPIVHIYGSLGKLPFEVVAGAVHRRDPSVPFGSSINSLVLQGCAETIRIMPERDRLKDALEEAHAVLKQAERIIFLGFGYDRTNLERLLEYGPTANQAFTGTAHGLTDAQVRQAVQYWHRLGVTSMSSPDNRHGDVLAFLREHCLLD